MNLKIGHVFEKNTWTRKNLILLFENSDWVKYTVNEKQESFSTNLEMLFIFDSELSDFF